MILGIMYSRWNKYKNYIKTAEKIGHVTQCCKSLACGALLKTRSNYDTPFVNTLLAST